MGINAGKGVYNMYYNELREKITAHAGKECADFAAKITTATDLLKAAIREYKGAKQ